MFILSALFIIGLILAIPVGIIWVIVAGLRWLLIRPSQSARTSAPSSSPVTSGGRDEDWRRYLASFRSKAVHMDAAALLDAILEGPDAPDQRPTEEFIGTVAPTQVPAAAATAPSSAYVLGQGSDTTLFEDTRPDLAPTVPRPAARELDNTLLLLYFGAFLFVASAGLFVAFAGFSGIIRTCIVVAVMAVLYGGGFWLYDRSRRLRPAGVAFVAIGMAIAPLVGVAAFHYVAHDRDAAFIWAATSVLCLMMYSYATFRLRLTFMSYLLIFSFLSLFESAVAITDASVRYYIWGLILAGMALRSVGLMKREWFVEEQANVSAQILVPLGLAVSLVMTGRQGAGQLAVSLLLAAVYYTFESVHRATRRPALAAAAQVLYIMGAALGTYAYRGSWLSVGWAIVALAALQAAAVIAITRRSELVRNFATIAFGSGLAGAALGFPHGSAMAAGLLMAVVLGGVAAWRQSRPDAYAGAACALIGLPFVLGQFLAAPHWTLGTQTAVAFVPLAILWLFVLWFNRHAPSSEWRDAAQAVYVIAGLVTLGTAAMHGSWVLLAAAQVLAFSLAAVAWIYKKTEWWVSTGLVSALPVVFSLDDLHGRLFAITTLVALAINVGITLIGRAEANRWFVAILGLLAPLAIAGGGLGFRTGPAGFAYLYLLALYCLLFSRCLARGIIGASSHVPVISFYRSASVSYVFGYVSAAVLAVLVSLASPHSHLHTSLILATVLLTVPFIAVKVEDRRELLTLVPYLSVALLTSLFRPDVSKVVADCVVLVASVMAVVSYQAVQQVRGWFGRHQEDVLNAMLLLAYLPLLLCVWYEVSVGIGPLVLMIAGCLTLVHVWNRTQSEREVGGLVIVAGLMWALYAAGIHAVQAYTHILAATFGLYAYWRYLRGDVPTSDEYLYAMLGTATVPLALQALNGQGGGLYGWWLLLEQICFMLLGITIHRRTVTMWGLYVAIGAVLYQLRNLGWAALSFLALFIIGMAIFRMLRVTGRGES